MLIVCGPPSAWGRYVITADDVYELRDLVKQDAIAWKREQYGHQP
jgi:hypothetical protein